MRERENACHKVLNGLYGSSKVSRAAFGDISSTEVTGGLREGWLAEGQWWEQQGRGEGGPADKANASLELGVSCRSSTG